MAADNNGMIDKKKLAQKLGIARSTLYYQSKKKAKDEEIKKEIIEVMESNPAYGYRRVAIALSMNGKPVARIMRNNGLKPRLCRRKWRKKGDIGLPVAQYHNEIKHVEILEPNIAWVADFTHIKYKSSWLYLATVIDIYTGEVIGSAISSRHNRFLVKSAALDAIKKRGLLPQYFHTDQGSEYQSEEHADFLAKLGVIVSMSKKGSPWENGSQESFYSQYKLELDNVNRFNSEGELIENIYGQIYYYNNIRIKTKLRMAPAKFYELTAKG
ncbi:MAG TPA: IS3 family transposase [Candidatus Woesebacteria bacterium]|nr:IS3 family transposase [Candidatus Woesebacteria bacterium]